MTEEELKLEQDIEKFNKLKHPLPSWIWSCIMGIVVLILWGILAYGGVK